MRSPEEWVLNAGHVVIFDREDLSMLRNWSWSVNNRGYAEAYDGGGRDHRRKVAMHRLLMSPAADEQVDHVNGNRLDNRRANLRICNNAENHFNVGPQKNNSSGFKGVSFDTARGRWQACIRAYGRRYHLGRFKSAEEAASAYDESARELHGEFCRPNLPRP